MKLAFVYGRWGTAYHGPFDHTSLFDGWRGLTGSENSFFNTARALAARGHDVHVTCDTRDGLWHGDDALLGAKLVPLPKSNDALFHLPQDCDAYVSWNEPDLLRTAPRRALRVCSHQLNDFDFCLPGYDGFVDAYAVVSRAQRDKIASKANIPPSKFEIIPNTIDRSLYSSAWPIEARGTTMAWVSSADRGLHRLLEIFPEVRRRVPTATLSIYYEWDKLWRKMRREETIVGMRVRHIAALLARQGVRGENGVHLHGSVSSRKLIEVLCRTRVMAYTCEPVVFTEGFSVATADACASGCVPIISDVDALGEIYGGVAEIVPGRPGERRTEWVDAICRALTDDAHAREVSTRARAWSVTVDLHVVSARWEAWLARSIEEKRERT
jgi:glycosyltransferase involved in cell wall biosynthesis